MPRPEQYQAGTPDTSEFPDPKEYLDAVACMPGVTEADILARQVGAKTDLELSQAAFRLAFRSLDKSLGPRIDIPSRERIEVPHKDLDRSHSEARKPVDFGQVLGSLSEALQKTPGSTFLFQHHRIRKN